MGPTFTSPIVEVADGIFVAVDPMGTLGRANAAAIVDRNSAVVFDSFLVPSPASSFRAELGRLGVTVATVVNSHPHADHVGGNAAFRPARLVAHAATVAMVREMAAVVDQDPSFLASIFPEFAEELAGIVIDVPAEIEPERDLPDGVGIIDVAGAHSPGDLSLWLPGAGVLLAGDVCSNGVCPMALPGQASIATWVSALEACLALEPRVVVPGHGSPTDLAALRRLHESLSCIGSLGSQVARGEIGQEEALAGVAATPIGKWAEPRRQKLLLGAAISQGPAGDGEGPAVALDQGNVESPREGEVSA